MALTLAADPLPLTRDEHGRVRVGGTRVFLEFVVNAFDAGATATDIAERFDTLELADIHAALAYILRHRAEVDVYMREQDEKAEEMRRFIEKNLPLKVSREELKARWAAIQGQGSEPCSDS